MPRFFFDVIDQGVIDPDDEGTELKDLGEAVEQAKQMIAELQAEFTQGSGVGTLVVQIHDGHREPEVTVLATRASVPEVVYRRG
jgi:hypothetical protein